MEMVHCIRGRQGQMLEIQSWLVVWGEGVCLTQHRYRDFNATCDTYEEVDLHKKGRKNLHVY